MIFKSILNIKSHTSKVKVTNCLCFVCMPWQLLWTLLIAFSKT